MTEFAVLALVAALNPTEVAVTVLLLLLPSPGRLMFGYWVGAMVAGMASGLVIVFVLEGTAAEHTTRHALGPIFWLLIAVLLVVAAFALARGEDIRLRERREARREKKGVEEKKTPKWQRTLQEGNAWQAFAVGIVLSLPGASYLAAMDRLIHLHYPALVTVLVLIGFNLVQNVALEVPMLAFRIWPE